MDERRRPAQDVTPVYEDMGIYKSPLVELTVQLVPMIAQNSRQDIMIKAFVAEQGAIDVVFPGRRKRLARPLVTRLNLMLTQARKRAGANTTLDVNAMRFPIRVQGAWRSRFKRDDQGWETRQHQLYAARWLVMDQNGQSMTYGEPPRLN